MSVSNYISFSFKLNENICFMFGFTVIGLIENSGFDFNFAHLLHTVNPNYVPKSYSFSIERNALSWPNFIMRRDTAIQRTITIRNCNWNDLKNVNESLTQGNVFEITLLIIASVLKEINVDLTQKTVQTPLARACLMLIKKRQITFKSSKL